MAYATGTVTGLRPLLSALNTFMTGNGWTLVDDLGVHDKVYFSTGVLDDQHMYIRVSMDARSLDFVGQTTNYTPGQTITGATSGATAHLLSVTDAGATGTLLLVDIKGVFVSGEAISDGLGGLANVSGRLRFPELFSPKELENSMDWLNVRHYTFWSTVTHTGVGQVDRVGPLLINNLSSNIADRQAASVFRVNGRQAGLAPYVLFENKDIYEKSVTVAAFNSPPQYNGYGAVNLMPTTGMAPPEGGASTALRTMHLAMLGSLRNVVLPTTNDVEGTRAIAYTNALPACTSCFVGRVVLLQPVCSSSWTFPPVYLQR